MINERRIIMNKYGLCDSFDRAKRLIDVAEEMQVILVQYFVNGFSRLSDEEQDTLFVKIDKVLRKYDEAYGNLI
jgi:hypothetical protein